jgi:hypothetical protein
MAVMQVQAGEVIGEDSVWYNGRPANYSATVISHNASFLQVGASEFIKTFGKIVPSMKEAFDLRNEFIVKRCEKLA